MILSNDSENFQLQPSRPLDENLFARIEHQLSIKNGKRQQRFNTYQKLALTTIGIVLAINFWAITTLNSTQSNEQTSLVNFYLSEFYNE